MSRIVAFFRNPFRKQQLDRELDAELRAFIDMTADEKVAQGLPFDEARRQALIECGGVEQVKESVREVRAGALLEQWVRDSRYGMRMLRKNPGFALVAVLTIALGIGVNSSIFAVFNSAALRPLKLREGNRVIGVYQTLVSKEPRSARGGLSLVSYPEYAEYAQRNQVFSGLAAYMPEVEASLNDGEKTAQGQLTTCNYFDVLDVKLAFGRGFSAAECAAAGKGAVVVISDRMWRHIFNADPAILGKSIKINRVPLAVIGVAPADFAGTEIVPSSFWAPISNQPALMRFGDEDLLHSEKVSWLSPIGRLKDGVTLEQARANLNVIAAGIDKRAGNRTSIITADRATLFGRPEMRSVVIPVGAVVLVAVGLVLLIACANLANLMLARTAARAHELSVRLALGASRPRLIRQLLTESLVIALIGGAIGLLLSIWTETALVKSVLARLPLGAAVTLDLSPDYRLFLYAFGLTILSGIASGLAPALRSSKSELNLTLKQDGTLSEPRRSRLANALTGIQVALCMVLLVAAGLLLRGLYHAQTIDPGFDMEHHASVSFDLGRENYSDAQASSFDHDLAERLRALPGVVDVVPVFGAPLADVHGISHFSKAGEKHEYGLEFNVVGSGLFSSLGVPLLRGRDFSEADISAGANVAIVSESTARKLWPGEDPIGKVLHGGLVKPRDFEVIGLAKDVQIARLGVANTPYLYLPAAPEMQPMIRAMLVHTTADSATTLPMLRSAAHSADPQMKFDVATLASNIDWWVTPSRIVVALATVLGTLGILLAAIGIYGTVSYSVSRRVREIGVRMALGAGQRDVMRLILRQAMRPVLIGTAVGVVLCGLLARLLRVLLFGVSPLDPLAYVSVALFLVCVALAASYLPARLALRIDPMSAIRCE